MPDLLRTEAALEDCRALLQGGYAGTPVEAYVTRYLVVVLCAETEDAIRELILDRVRRRSEEDVHTLVRNLTRNFVKNLRHAEIRNALGHFGSGAEARYDAALRAVVNDEGIQALANLVQVRDDVAHRVPPSVSFAELESAFVVARHLVNAVRSALEAAEPRVPVA